MAFLRATDVVLPVHSTGAVTSLSAVTFEGSLQTFTKKARLARRRVLRLAHWGCLLRVLSYRAHGCVS